MADCLIGIESDAAVLKIAAVVHHIVVNICICGAGLRMALVVALCTIAVKARVGCDKNAPEVGEQRPCEPIMCWAERAAESVQVICFDAE